MDKDEFINKLSIMTKEEIENFIEENGKGPKPISLVLWDTDGGENMTHITEL